MDKSINVEENSDIKAKSKVNTLKWNIALDFTFIILYKKDSMYTMLENNAKRCYFLVSTYVLPSIATVIEFWL